MKVDWVIKPLPDIAEYFIGLTYKPEDVGNLGTIVLRSSNVQNDALDLSDLVRVNRSVKKSLYVRKGDILMCSRNGSKRLVGKAAVIGDLPEEMTFGTFMTVVRSDCSPYLSWFFRSEVFRDQIGVGENTMINQITKYMLDAIRVPVPPPAEQQRIVTLLDEAFDGIVTAKVNAEKNLQNARSIFESHLQSVFTQRGDGWEDKTLDQVCIVERGSSPRPIKEFFTTASDGVNWIKIGDTEEGGKYVHTTAQKITPAGAKQSRFVREGDFILTNSMSYGRPYIMKTSGYIHDGWFVLRLNMSIDTDYFYYLLSSGFVQSQFALLASGSVVKNISGDLVKRVVLQIPPLDQQQVIVTKLLEMSAATQRLEAVYQQKLTALDELKKSLLHRAFNGEL